MEDADAVQVDTLLPPQGHFALPQPDALPGVAHHGPAEQHKEENGGDEQRHGHGGQDGDRHQREQGAERKGDADRCKKDEAALGGVGPDVRWHLEFRQQLPEQCLAAGAVDEERKLRRAAARRDKHRPALEHPGRRGDPDVGIADLGRSHPALKAVDPAAPAPDLRCRVPDLVVHGLGKAACQTGPEQCRCQRQQPGRARRQPPGCKGRQMPKLGKRQRLSIQRELPRLPDGQRHQRQRGNAVGSQQDQCGPLTPGGGVEGRRFNGEQAVRQLPGVGPAQAEGDHMLPRLPGGVEGDLCRPAQPEQRGPLQRQGCQRFPPDGRVQFEQQLPAQVQDSGLVQLPAAEAQDDPAHPAEQGKQDGVLP